MTHAPLEHRASFARNPLDLIDHAHAHQMRMCDAMERIADGLPDDVDRRLCAQVASCLYFDLPAHHHDEETALFPLLLQRTGAEHGLDEIIERLTSEHATDNDFAAEIAEALELLGQGGAPRNPDMLGYMLRGFFERYRRHVHWETTLVMPLARAHLTSADLEGLAARMDANRRQSL